MKWIKFVKDDFNTYPENSGNYDYTSKLVLVKFKRSYPWNDQVYRALAYTDWDGDETSWRLEPYNHPYANDFEILEWAYID